MSSKSFQVETYGCKVNYYDTGLLQKRLGASGYLLAHSEPDIHILNTCAVTEEATKEALRRIRRIKAKNPQATVVVTGCAAQVDTNKFESLSGADLVVANSHKGDLENLIAQHLKGELKQKVFKSNIFKKEDLEAGGGREISHTRSFLKIQDGCNSFCTYCVIPFARGKSRSILIDDLIDRVNVLYAEGVREVVLTGVHIGDYEDDFFGPEHKRGLEDLLEQLLVRTKMPRFRLSSLEPVELNDRLFDLYSDPRMCPHFHMSIQSANTKVLKDMKRQYTAQDVEWALTEIYKRVKSPFVGMDVIVGFAGEAEDEFQDTYRRLEALPWTRAHVFPYSERPGTFANRMKLEKWPRHLIMERAKKLRSLSSERFSKEALKQVGLKKELMLIKDKQERVTRGVSADYWTIYFDEAPNKNSGEFATVEVKGFSHADISKMDGMLMGRLC